MTQKKITRRQALKLAGISAAAATAKLAFPLNAFSWSSIWFTNTHANHIDKYAYEQLSKLPFFKASGFPELENILKNEGTDAAMGKGYGPDRSGSSDFSKHYFNPWLNNGEGEGPAACGEHARKLYDVLNNTGRSKQNTSKSAAWSAHFMADMSVPYHVVGCSKQTLEKLFTTGELKLTKQITGDLGLSYQTTLPADDEFSREAKRFLAAAKEDETINWFDPWYWNGATGGSIAYINSSHVYWEKDVGMIKWWSYTPSPHHGWKNPDPAFENPGKGFQEKAEQLAWTCALDTRMQLMERYQSKQSGIEVAGSAVYTLWRASITALDASVVIVPNDQGPGHYVSFAVKNMDPKGTVTQVKARGAILRKGQFFKRLDPVDAAASISAGGSKKVQKAWLIDTRMPIQYGPWEVELEVIGKFKDTPDAQYKAVKKTIEARWPRVYKGNASTAVTVTTNKGSIVCREQSPMKIVLKEPEDGKGEIAISITSGLWYKFGQNVKPECKKRNPNTYTFKGIHDGKTSFKIQPPKGKPLRGTFNEAQVQAKLNTQQTNRGSVIITDIAFVLLLSKSGGTGTDAIPPATQEKKIKALDNLEEVFQSDSDEKRQDEWQTIPDMSEENEGEQQIQNAIDILIDQ